MITTGPFDPPAAPPAGPPKEFDGEVLPGELFSGDPALEHAWVRISPTEASFFVDRPADEVVELCRGIAGHVRPNRRVMHDRYFDLPDGSLFARGVSVRLREYAEHTRPLAFEIIAISWRGMNVEGPLDAHTNRVLVQTFERNGPEDLAAMRRQYAAAGFVPTAELGKSRTAFDLRPILEKDGTGIVRPGLDNVGLLGARGDLRVLDLGLKLLVDHIHQPAFSEPTIVEVEYGKEHEAQAAEVVARLRDALGPDLRPKERNKIAYLLAG